MEIREGSWVIFKNPKLLDRYGKKIQYLQCYQVEKIDDHPSRTAYITIKGIQDQIAICNVRLATPREITKWRKSGT